MIKKNVLKTFWRGGEWEEIETLPANVNYGEFLSQSVTWSDLLLYK